MIVLQNKKLIRIDLSEDTVKIKAIKLIKDLKFKSAVKSQILQLISNTIGHVGYNKYDFKVVQCPFKDDSSLNDSYYQFNTKGEAIYKMLNDGYTITFDGKEVTKDQLT